MLQKQGGRQPAASQKSNELLKAELEQALQDQ